MDLVNRVQMHQIQTKTWGILIFRLTSYPSCYFVGRMSRSQSSNHQKRFHLKLPRCKFLFLETIKCLANTCFPSFSLIGTSENLGFLWITPILVRDSYPSKRSTRRKWSLSLWSYRRKFRTLAITLAPVY